MMPNIVSDTSVTGPDGTVTETVVYDDGSRRVVTTPAPGSTNANAQTLQARGAAALTANATFQALASPTNAQTVAQVQTLTKECNALIRLALNLLDSTSGT